MSERTPNRTRRIVLPSGKTIEISYFAAREREPIGAPALLGERELEDLHICAQCDSRLVFPERWHEVSAQSWEVTLRCPNCELRRTSIFDQPTVERFDVILDHGTELLVEDLRRLASANMHDDIDRFAAALHADQILPEDF